MKKWIPLILLINSIGYAQNRVVILDTGLNLEDPRFKELLCPDYPGIDFTGYGIEDTNGHGTHVAGLIKQYAKDANYCLTIIKYYSVLNNGLTEFKKCNKSINLDQLGYSPSRICKLFGRGRTME